MEYRYEIDASMTETSHGVFRVFGTADGMTGAIEAREAYDWYVEQGWKRVRLQIASVWSHEPFAPVVLERVGS